MIRSRNLETQKAGLSTVTLDGQTEPEVEENRERNPVKGAASGAAAERLGAADRKRRRNECFQKQPRE